MRTVFLFIATLALMAVPATAHAAPAVSVPHHHEHAKAESMACSARAFRSYARAVYQRERISKRALRRLDRLRVCLKPWALRYQKKLGRQRYDRMHPWSYATASWFSPADSGGTPACGLGWPATGVAHKTLPCGTRVRICAARCIDAVVADRGPYIGGREFDLMPGAKSGTGCGDLCRIRYRIGK